MFRYLIMLMMMLMTALSLSAQKHMDKVVAEITKSGNVTSIIYSEERGGAGNKLVESKRFISFSDMDYNQKIYDAMTLDRPKSSSYKEVVGTGGSGVYTIEFHGSGKTVTTYTLLCPNSISITTVYK